MGDELITGSVHGSLSSGQIESSNLDCDKREMSKPYGRQEIFHKALEAAADREREQRRALSISEVQAEIWKIVNEFHITGPGVSGQGTEWSVHPLEPKPQKTATSAVATKYPFTVLDQSNPDDGLQVKVYKDSFLYPTTDLTAPASISGLDAIQSVSVGDVVALRIALDSALALDGTPDMLFTTGAWSGYPAMYSVDNSDPDNPFVDEIRVLVAEIVDVSDTRDGKTITDGSSSAKIIQHQRSNILLFAYPDVVDAAAVATYIPLSI